MYRGGLLTITILLIILSPQSYAQQNNIYASPGPSNGNNLAPGPGGSNVQETCSMASRSCQLKNITACLPYPQSGHQELFLIVQNNGENIMNVKIIILPANNTIQERDLQSHQMEKINVSLYVGNGLSSSIALNAGEGNCIIHPEASAPQNNYYQKFPSSDTYVTPINGGYLAVLLIIIVGGIVACFKSRNRGRHLDGVAYHELEMGNSTALSSLNVEEEEEGGGWDQYWDDEWDEEKTVKSHGKNHENGKVGNGLTTKTPDSKGLENNWND